jgi:hypothetical protein
MSNFATHGTNSVLAIVIILQLYLFCSALCFVEGQTSDAIRMSHCLFMLFLQIATSEKKELISNNDYKLNNVTATTAAAARATTNPKALKDLR